eukprot:6188754-Alexandrium_andersonii.AAC.1
MESGRLRRRSSAGGEEGGGRGAARACARRRGERDGARGLRGMGLGRASGGDAQLSLIHISEPTRLALI